MNQPKPTRGGKRPGAGRKRLALDGTLRKPRTFSVTDLEWMYLRDTLDWLRTSSNAPGQCATNPDEIATP